MIVMMMIVAFCFFAIQLKYFSIILIILLTIFNNKILRRWKLLIKSSSVTDLMQLLFFYLHKMIFFIEDGYSKSKKNILSLNRFSSYLNYLFTILFSLIQSIMSYNGGAVMAMRGKNCVAIAADRRFGIQAQMVTTDFQKIFPMGERLYIGLAGLATDVQTV